MTAQHTQGPWEIARLNRNGPYAIRMAYNPEQKFYGVRQIHHEADARLIAAAPDMLGALIAVRARFQGYNHGPDEQMVMDRVIAAIAKALGRTPNEIGEEG